MNDKRLYEQLLGLAPPWHVEEVTLELKDGRVLIALGGGAGIELCPECGRRCPRYDAHERRWRHLDMFQYETILVARVPRVECREHGIRRIRVPWAEERSRFTALFEALVIDWLRNTEQIAAVAKGMRLTWDQVDGIRARAVARGMARRGRVPLPAAVGVDETSITRGHEYVTVVSSLAEPVVLDVRDERRQESLDGFWEQYTPEERSVVEAVAMDMWDPYIASTKAHLTDAGIKIVFDRFHIMKHLGEAVDKVRRSEHRELRARGDDRLTRTKYLWLSRPGRLERAARALVLTLARTTLRTAKAYRYKEWASKLWGYVRRGMATRLWQAWLRSATRCGLEPIRRVARMIQRHWDGVINAATSDVTNAMAESVNSHIQRIKKRACGFRNRERFRAAILFHLGRLDLYPSQANLTHSNP